MTRPLAHDSQKKAAADAPEAGPQPAPTLTTRGSTSAPDVEHVFAYDDRSNLPAGDARGVRTTYPTPATRSTESSVDLLHHAGVATRQSAVEAAPTITYQYATAGPTCVRLALVTARACRGARRLRLRRGRPPRRANSSSQSPLTASDGANTPTNPRQLDDVRFRANQDREYRGGTRDKYVHSDYARRVSPVGVSRSTAWITARRYLQRGHQMTRCWSAPPGASQITETATVTANRWEGVRAPRAGWGGIVRNATRRCSTSLRLWGVG